MPIAASTRPARCTQRSRSPSTTLASRTVAGQADLALIGASGAPPAGLGALPIISERLVAALPPGHPLAGRPRVTLADISAYPIVCMPAGTGIRTVLDQACAAQGIRPDIALQASAPGAVADLAIRGLGIAILSESMAASYDAQLKTLVIDPALPEWLPRLVVRNLWIGEDRASIALHRSANGDTDYEILEGAEGWRIVRPDPGAPGRDRFALALAEAFTP